MRPARAAIFPALALLALTLGLLARLHPDTASWSTPVWRGALWVLGLPLLWRTLRGVFRGQWKADLVAALAILGAILLDQPFAGLVIVLMQTGGEGLETFAIGRASAAVRALEADAPQIAHRALGDTIEDVPVARIRPGDRLLVRPGEMVPCDGRVEEGHSTVDTARLTGEPIPVTAVAGTLLASGSVNLSGAIWLRSTAPASESLYARIVDLVRHAQESKAPFQRIADRYALWFTPLTLGVCVVAWFLSHDPVRVLAVLVVATPCPMLLATPVAILGGVNRAARRQIIIRHGAALEQLARVDTVVLDKTGTVTIGQPGVDLVRPVPPWTETSLLALAAAVERGSGHPLARSVERAAAARGLPAEGARGIEEFPGQGVRGVVRNHRVLIGSPGLAAALEPGAVLPAFEPSPLNGAGLRAVVIVDGTYAGQLDFADRVRNDTRASLAALASLGITRLVLLSGDDGAAVAHVARDLGIPDARGNLLPGDKVDVVRALEDEGATVLMVGDGTNDAPALSTASVGMAITSHGGGISAEAADIVLLSDDLRRIPEAVQIGRRTLRIARQSLWTGVGLSVSAMVVAAAGGITPAVGALLQEAVDVAVILNALRTALPDPQDFFTPRE